MFKTWYSIRIRDVKLLNIWNPEVQFPKCSKLDVIQIGCRSSYQRLSTGESLTSSKGCWSDFANASNLPLLASFAAKVSLLATNPSVKKISLTHLSQRENSFSRSIFLTSNSAETFWKKISQASLSRTSLWWKPLTSNAFESASHSKWKLCFKLSTHFLSFYAWKRLRMQIVQFVSNWCIISLTINLN